jgi:aminodeoxyfutalosine synthase
MAATTNDLFDLERRLTSGEPFTRADAERVLLSADLISVGMLGEAMRKSLHGDEVTYGRVYIVSGTAAAPPDDVEAGEIRIEAAPDTVDELRALVRAAAPSALGIPLTGFSLGHLLALTGGDHLELAALARMLRAEGLEAVGEVPLDSLGDTENAIEVIRAVQHGGLAAWRATVARAPMATRLDLIERAIEVQSQTGALRAFAPLPRVDPVDAPSTGYDDVRTIAAARLWARAIPAIQVDWLLYGPKLAQVAIAYGADDIDGIAAQDVEQLGRRRAPKDDIERQIRAASATPVERNGRYDRRA